MKNPELLKAKQARREEIERKAAATGGGGGGGGLKVSRMNTIVVKILLSL